VDVPVEQLVADTTHAPAGVHGVPAVQALHAPLLQTMFVPHAVPFDPGIIVSVHVDAPVAHDVVPRSHWLVGVQDAPAVQAVHVPPLQTMLVPQAVPFCAGPSVSVHVGVPVEHEVVPVWHGSAGVHAEPEVQLTQAPSSQTMFVPQTVPSDAVLPVSLQTEVPPLHVRVPVWQALAGVHGAPLVQTVHPPSSQTPLPAQDVPFGRRLCVGAHVETPVEQLVA
jgi:hypothetical protein